MTRNVLRGVGNKGRGQEVGSREKSGREEYGVRERKEVESGISEKAGMAWETGENSTESENTLRPYLHPPLRPPVENI